MIIIHYGWNSKTTIKYLKNIKIALFTDKYKSFIDEYEEEYEKNRNELENWEKKILVDKFYKYIF